jgi:hypothetical protein
VAGRCDMVDVLIGLTFLILAVAPALLAIELFEKKHF